MREGGEEGRSCQLVSGILIPSYQLVWFPDPTVYNISACVRREGFTRGPWNSLQVTLHCMQLCVRNERCVREGGRRRIG